MKKLIIFCLLILSAALCHAQGSVRGKVVDTGTGESMPFVNVAVYDKATQKFVKGAISDEKGLFHITGLPYGSYTSPELAMPAFCNLNVSWNALAPDNTMLEVRCRVYAGGDWTGWMSLGSPIIPVRASVPLAVRSRRSTWSIRCRMCPRAWSLPGWKGAPLCRKRKKYAPLPGISPLWCCF